MKCSIDIETFSECDLKACGVFKYAEDESTEILVICFAFDDEPVETYVPYRDGPVPDRLRKHIESGGIVSAFNYQFERTVLNGVAGKKINFPPLSIEQGRCSMLKARVMGLPGSLAGATEAMGVETKMASGRGVMLQLSKPRRGKEPRYTPENSPDKFEQLYQYCRQDTEAERALDAALPDVTPDELEVYRLDARMNSRGWQIDREAIDSAIIIRDQYKERLAGICQKQTGFKPTQSGKLAEWVRANGYPQLQNLQAATVAEAVTDPACPKSVRTVLRCYSAYGMKAVSKFDSMLKAACSDDRLRGMLLIYGAAPGRWSSRIVQLQNIMRPVIKDVDVAIDAMCERDLDWLRFLYPDIDPMKVLASTVRGMLTAPQGRRLVVYDFAQIESRIQAWLAGAEWKLQVFREGKHKIYNVTGSVMFGCKPEEVVDDGEHQRYTAAKIGELAAGFGGGEVAIEKFARQMGIELTISANEIKDRWRDANSEQVKLWYEIQDVASHAIKNTGRAFAISNRKLAFKVDGRWLYMRLPSGRKLAYLDPVMEEADVTFMGVNTYTRKWERVRTWGAKLLQNACEGIGRDLLVAGLMNMERAGYETIGLVHDEGIFEVDNDFGSGEEAERLMTVPLKWAAGLPVAASGFITKRYRK